MDWGTKRAHAFESSDSAKEAPLLTSATKMILVLVDPNGVGKRSRKRKAKREVK